MAGQRQAPGFNYDKPKNEYSGQSRSDNMALAMGVEQELLDKIAAEAKEKKGKDIFTEGIESSVWSTSAGLTELADMFIGKPLQSLGWEDNFISEWNEYYQDKAEEKHQDLMDAAARTGKGKTAETAAILVEMLGEAGIDALLGMVTGGASAAAKLGSKGGKITKVIDKTEDLIEYEDLKKILGKNAPKSFDDYKYLKYNKGKEYLSELNKYLIKYPNSNRKYYDAMIELKKKGIDEGIFLQPVKKQAFILPSGKNDPYHIMKRMTERNITDDMLRSLMDEAKCMVSQWGGTRQLFIGEKGACVIVNHGDIWVYKTAWLKDDFNENNDIIMEVLNNVGL